MANGYSGSQSSLRYEAPGAWSAANIHPGSRYELNDGHPVYCAPTGGDGARTNLVGAGVLGTDPIVKEAGIDAGYSSGPKMLRAPDVAIGNVPDQREWIQGVPPLAVEYAGAGQDENDLQDKIKDFLSAGTQAVWVVRLLGPRRVEVYEPNKAARLLGPGDTLSAPGILQNTYPVEALYDQSTALELTLRNLLQRRGYESLDEVREEGREEGRTHALLSVLDARGIQVSEAEKARILASRDGAQLDDWLRRASIAKSLADVFS